jgi:ATP-dependent protease HslVU (ClpYQ) peptidase subunit
LTCIVAVAKDGKTWMGGDSAGVCDLSLVQRADAKVFEKDGYLFGFTSSFRMGQLLRYRLSVPRRHADEDLMAFMATSFVDAVRDCLKEHGFARIENGVEEGGTFLVAVEGRIFRVCDDYQIGESVHPYDACGCGEEIARGALFAMHNDYSNRTKVAPRIMVDRALKAAEMFSGGVRGPFRVIEAAGQ